MTESPSKVYSQALLVISSAEPTDLAEPKLLTPTISIGPGCARATIAASNTSAFTSNLLTEQSRILRKTLSSVPVIWESELYEEYRELGRALSEMTNLANEYEWSIETPVYQTANVVAAELSARAIPAPQVFSHGPKSVVFNWTLGQNNIYLTISSDKISALVSSPERIKRRIEIPVTSLAGPTIVLSAMRSLEFSQAKMISKPNTDPADLGVLGE